MKLIKQEFINGVNTIKEMIIQSDKITKALHVDSSICDEWISKYYNLFSKMCQLEENIDGGSLLDWYCFSTNFGEIDNILFWESFDETGKTRQTRITTPEELYDFIDTDYIHMRNGMAHFKF